MAILGLCSVLVAALFGVLLGAPASLLAGTVGSRRAMSQIMQTALVGIGLVMIIAAMGELGLTRRLAIVRAIVAALLVKICSGGKVETVLTLPDHFFGFFLAMPAPILFCPMLPRHGSGYIQARGVS